MKHKMQRLAHALRWNRVTMSVIEHPILIVTAVTVAFGYYGASSVLSHLESVR